mmetsp:Transcript_104621/g.273156  ORF Transcript_104621/g.273156 Transcript_104621/m.273156 type:complete len:236 (+) Transcript_104621:600-1307(+)
MQRRHLAVQRRGARDGPGPVLAAQRAAQRHRGRRRRVSRGAAGRGLRAGQRQEGARRSPAAAGPVEQMGHLLLRREGHCAPPQHRVEPGAPGPLVRRRRLPARGRRRGPAPPEHLCRRLAGRAADRPWRASPGPLLRGPRGPQRGEGGAQDRGGDGLAVVRRVASHGGRGGDLSGLPKGPAGSAGPRIALSSSPRRRGRSATGDAATGSSESACIGARCPRSLELLPSLGPKCSW